jgi:hypothetical protein
MQATCPTALYRFTVKVLALLVPPAVTTTICRVFTGIG